MPADLSGAGAGAVRRHEIVQRQSARVPAALQTQGCLLMPFALSCPSHLLAPLQVPPVDSPLLALLAMTTQLRWHDVCNGGRLLHALLQQHPGALPPPPACSGRCSKECSLLLPELALPGCEAQAETVETAAAAMPPAALPGPLAAFLASNGLLPALQQAQQATGSSSSSEDTCGVEVEGGAAAASSAGACRPSASSGSSLASTGSSWALKGGVKGLGLPHAP